MTFAPVEPNADDIAYLQYTSGSTRTPRGVEIIYRAVGTNLLQMIFSMDLDSDADVHGVSWLPLYDDMGLLMIGFPVLYSGHLTLMSPMAFAVSRRHGMALSDIRPVAASLGEVGCDCVDRPIP